MVTAGLVSAMPVDLIPNASASPLAWSLTRRLGGECNSLHVNAILKAAALKNDPEAVEIVHRAHGHSYFAHIEKAAEPFKNDRDGQEHSRLVVDGHLKARLWKRPAEGGGYDAKTVTAACGLASCTPGSHADGDEKGWIKSVLSRRQLE